MAPTPSNWNPNFSVCEKPICFKPMIKFVAFHKHSNHKKGSPILKQKQEHQTTICLVKAISNFKRQSFQQKTEHHRIHQKETKIHIWYTLKKHHQPSLSNRESSMATKFKAQNFPKKRTSVARPLLPMKNRGLEWKINKC